uniref:Retroviral polymerase SH3-like domain-containing protein n=1 Tax=Opuntia streptacantha TaxID=393608 RepID=A0A7C9DMC2_OPUST
MNFLKKAKSNIMHLRIFGCKCYVHNNGNDALVKFDPRSDEVIFLRYSSHSKAYMVFNKEPHVLRKVCMYCLMNLTLSLRMMHRMKILSWDLLGKMSCQLMKKEFPGRIRHWTYFQDRDARF